MSLKLSHDTFAPSTVSRMVAECLRVAPGDVVIDVGCGSGILGIIAAKLGASHIHAVDLSPDVVAVGKENAASQGVADQLTFYQGDLFAPIPEDVRQILSSQVVPVVIEQHRVARRDEHRNPFRVNQGRSRPPDLSAPIPSCRLRPGPSPR